MACPFPESLAEPSDRAESTRSEIPSNPVPRGAAAKDGKGTTSGSPRSEGDGSSSPAVGAAASDGRRPPSGAPKGAAGGGTIPECLEGAPRADAGASSPGDGLPALDRLRDYMKGLVGPGKRFARLREMGEALGMRGGRMSILYKFLSCSVDPRASLVLGWLEKLGVPVDYAASRGKGVDFLPVLSGRTGAGAEFPMPGEGRETGFRAVDGGVAGIIGVSLGECCFLDVTDDSMEPLFRKGASLIVDFSDAARRYPVEGRIYLVRHMDAVLVRRLRLGRGSVVLHSENPFDRPVTIGPGDLEEFEVLGRVRWYSSAV